MRAPRPLSDNPYQPPRADLDVPREQGPAPRRVRVAANLIWLCAALGLVLNAATFTGLIAMPGPRPLPAFEIFNALFAFALLALIAWKVRAGRNWARWVMAVLVALGVLGIVLSASFATEAFKAVPAVLWVTGAVNMALQAVILYLLFSGEAAEWYRRAS